MRLQYKLPSEITSSTLSVRYIDHVLYTWDIMLERTPPQAVSLDDQPYRGGDGGVHLIDEAVQPNADECPPMPY